MTQRKIRTSSPNRKKVKAKAKKPTIAQIKKKLWHIFSQYIRIRDANKQGYVECVCSGKKMYWKGKRGVSGQNNAGHFIAKKFCPPLYYEESNVHCQWSYINNVAEGLQYIHGLYIIKRYGQKEMDRLWKISNEYSIWKEKNPNKTYTWDRAWLDAKVIEYTNKLKIELEKRNIKI